MPLEQTLTHGALLALYALPGDCDAPLLHLGTALIPAATRPGPGLVAEERLFGCTACMALVVERPGDSLGSYPSASCTFARPRRPRP